MKKMKIVLLATFGLLALTSCNNQNNEQPESNFYKISFVNQATDTTDVDKPEITFITRNLIEKGKDCDLLVGLEPFSMLNNLASGKQIEIRRSSLLGDGALLDESHYTVKATETDCVYRLQIPKEYMTTSYDVFVNYTYLSGSTYSYANHVDVDTNIENSVSVALTNSSVNYDLTFHVMPKNYQVGATFDGETKDRIKIVGVKQDGAEENLTPYLSRKELVYIDSSVQGVSHYRTDAKSLRVAIPMEYLYEPAPDAFYGYKKKYETIKVESEDPTKVVSYNEERYLNLINAKADEASCVFNEGKIYEDSTSHDMIYEANFAAKDGYKFSSREASFSLTDFVVKSNTHAITGHPYFRDFIIHKDESLRQNIKSSPYGAYNGDSGVLGNYYFEDQLGNVYTPMKNWIACNFETTTAKIMINLNKMVKYIQFPTNKIISGYSSYIGGSIDFIKSFDFTICAFKN